MISVIVLTYNNSKTLAKTLDSVKEFDEVLILDSGSSDSTKEIANAYPNTKFIENIPFPGFGLQRQLAEKKAKHDWILAVDSDEILTQHLKKEIFNQALCSNTIYAIPRHNFFGGKRIYHSSWSPDYCLRLYYRKKTGFNSALVHENIRKQNCVIKKFKNAILHTPYLEISDFLKKMETYSSYFAKQNLGKKSSSFYQAILRGAWSFLRTYFIKLGILDGKEGFIISLYNAHCTYYKYLKLYQMSKNASVPT